MLFLFKGFQMIVDIPSHIDQKMRESIRRVNCRPTEYNRLLSIGRIYHTLSLVIEETPLQDSVAIYVQQYKPQCVNPRETCLLKHRDLHSRYISETRIVGYKYRFQCPDSSDYDPAFYNLQLENLEAFPWNLVDNVVINQGSGEHKLSDVRREIVSTKIELVLFRIRLDDEVLACASGDHACFQGLHDQKYRDGSNQV
jgi:hypothetical protein